MGSKSSKFYCISRDENILLQTFDIIKKFIYQPDLYFIDNVTKFMYNNATEIPNLDIN